MLMKTKMIDNTVIVMLEGELDHSNCTDVRKKIDKEILAGKVKNIIFDYENLDFMDSSGIGVIIGRYKKLLSFNGKVAIVNMKPQVKALYDICGLHKIIAAFNSVEDAIKNI